AEESTEGIAMAWTAPEETGFGPGGEALLEGYKVQLSRCANTQIANCGVSTFHVPLLPSCNATALDPDSRNVTALESDSRNATKLDGPKRTTRCVYTLPTKMIEAAGLYYIRVAAANEVARGSFALSPVRSVAYGSMPFVVSPSPQSFPLGVVEISGAAQVMVDGVPRTTLTLVVWHFPPLAVGTLLAPLVEKGGVVKPGHFPPLAVGTLLAPLVEKGGVVRPGVARLIARSVVLFGAELDGSSGYGVQSVFEIAFPFFSSGAGEAILVLSAPNKPTDQDVRLTFNYFTFPDATVVLISPSSGPQPTVWYLVFPDATVVFISPSSEPQGGGNLVQIQVREPTGPNTRVSADVTNFLNTPASAISVGFGDTST
ncbi:hypothetical protein T484DRAFT_1832727, partial [Baffinella frigidus]